MPAVMKCPIFPYDIMAQYYFQRASAELLLTEAIVISEQSIGWIIHPEFTPSKWLMD